MSSDSDTDGPHANVRLSTRPRKGVIPATQDQDEEDPSVGAGHTNGLRSFVKGSFAGIQTRADLLSNTILARDQIQEMSELHGLYDNLQRVEVDWKTLASDLQEYTEEHERVQASDDVLINDIKEGYKCMGNWDNFRSIANLDSDGLLSLRDKLPADILPTLVRLLILCYDGPESIKDLPAHFREVFTRDVQQVKVLDWNQPPPSQNTVALHSQLGDATTTAERQKTTISTHETTIHRLKATIKEQTKNMDKLKSTVDGHTQKMTEKKTAMEKLNRQIQVYEKDVGGYKKRETSLEAINQQQLDQLEELRFGLDKLQTDKDDIEMEHKETKKEMEKLRAEAPWASDDFLKTKTYSKTTNALKARVLSLQQQLAREEARHARYVRKVERKEKAARREMTSQLELCRTERDKAQLLATSRQAQIDEYTETNNGQQKTIAGLRQQNEKYVKEGVEASSSASNQRLEIMKRDEEIKNKRKQLTSKDKEIQSLNSRITVLTGHVDQATVDQDEMTRLQDELDQKNTAITELKSQLTSTKSQLSESQIAQQGLQKQVKKFEQDTTRISAELTLARIELEAKKDELGAKCKEYDETVTNYEKQLQTAGKQIKKVREDYTECRKDKQELRDEITKLQEDLDKSIKENDTQLADMERLERDLRKSKKSSRKSKKLYQTLTTEKITLTTEKIRLLEFLAALCGVKTITSRAFQHLLTGVHQSLEHGQVGNIEEVSAWRILNTWSEEIHQHDLRLSPLMECQVLPLFGMVDGRDVSLWQCQTALQALIESVRLRPEMHTRQLTHVVGVVLPWAAKYDKFEVALVLWQLICLVQVRWNTMASAMSVHQKTVEEYLRGHVYSQVFAMIDGSCGIQDLEGDGSRVFSDTVIFSDSTQKRMVMVNTVEQTVRCFTREHWQCDESDRILVGAGDYEVVIDCKTDADVEWALMQFY